MFRDTLYFLFNLFDIRNMIFMSWSKEDDISKIKAKTDSCHYKSTDNKGKKKYVNTPFLLNIDSNHFSVVKLIWIPMQSLSYINNLQNVFGRKYMKVQFSLFWN